jgi:hypothetical protein
LIVIFSLKQDFEILHWFFTKLEEIKIRHTYICMQIPSSFTTVTYYNPYFFKHHKKELKKVYNLLYDDESRRILASRIKSIITGNIGYIAQSNYSQYFHPVTIPQCGDIILDAGVSENITVERKFSELIGNN